MLVVVSSAGAQATPVVGVLENVQCVDSSALAVRPLFSRSGADWIALDSRRSFNDAVPAETSWTIVRDGAMGGAVRTDDPRRTSRLEDVRDRWLRVQPGQRLPHRANSAHGFAGWCWPPSARPLAVVTPSPSGDPDVWRPYTPAANIRSVLLPAFRRVFQHVVVCPAGAEKGVAFHYSARDLRVVSSYQNRHGRHIIGIGLDPKASNCDGPPDPVWGTSWFVLEPQPRFLESRLELVDTGDYDGDGRSELLFWYSGYNRDGYTLFSDDFAKRADLWWGYH